MLAELADALHQQAPQSLNPASARDWALAGDDTARARVIVDHIAALTEPQAIAQHHRVLRNTRNGP